MTTRLTSARVASARVVSVLAGAVCTVLAGAALPAAAASVADQDVLASLKDPRGDVRIHQRVRGLTTDERTSIDLRKVTVESRGSVTRFTVQMRDVRRTRDWDQMVFVNFVQPAGSADVFSGSVGFSPQVPATSYAYLYFGENMSEFESCDPLRAKVSWQRDLVSLDVPTQCMPELEAKVRVESLTGYFRSDASGPWSSDKAHFPGTVVLR
jgi:hypothetical protein